MRPYRCVTMTARLRGVIAAERASGSIVIVRGSMSTKTGMAPIALMAVTLYIPALAVVSTSSPGESPSARRPISSASVPLATPTPYLTWQNAANSCSKASTSGPRMYQPLARTRATASSMAGFSRSYCRRRSFSGTTGLCHPARALRLSESPKAAHRAPTDVAAVLAGHAGGGRAASHRPCSSRDSGSSGSSTRASG